MKIYFLVLIPLIYGCAPGENPSQKKEVFKEALLRTRHIYSADRNVDYSNPLRINFYRQYSGQLIELDMSASKMNTSFYSIFNSDSLKSVKDQLPPPEVLLSELKVEIDGNDVTGCLVEECNSTKCLAQSSNIFKFSSSFDTKRLFLNLTKISGASSCSGIDFNSGARNHVISFSERVSRLNGARLKVNVIVYNRTYHPRNIQNVFIQ